MQASQPKSAHMKRDFGIHRLTPRQLLRFHNHIPSMCFFYPPQKYFFFSLKISILNAASTMECESSAQRNGKVKPWSISRESSVQYQTHSKSLLVLSTEPI